MIFGTQVDINLAWASWEAFLTFAWTRVLWYRNWLQMHCKGVGGHLCTDISQQGAASSDTVIAGKREDGMAQHILQFYHEASALTTFVLPWRRQAWGVRNTGAWYSITRFAVSHPVVKGDDDAQATLATHELKSFLRLPPRKSSKAHLKIHQRQESTKPWKTTTAPRSEKSAAT